MPARKATGDDFVGPPTEEEWMAANSAGSSSGGKSTASDWLNGITNVGNSIASILGKWNRKENYNYEIEQRSGGLSTGAWLGIMGGVVVLVIVLAVALKN